MQHVALHFRLLRGEKNWYIRLKFFNQQHLYFLWKCFFFFNFLWCDVRKKRKIYTIVVRHSWWFFPPHIHFCVYSMDHTVFLYQRFQSCGLPDDIVSLEDTRLSLTIIFISVLWETGHVSPKTLSLMLISRHSWLTCTHFVQLEATWVGDLHGVTPSATKKGKRSVSGYHARHASRWFEFEKHLYVSTTVCFWWPLPFCAHSEADQPSHCFYIL